MANEWFFKEMGIESGPITSDDIKRLAENGTITADTLIRKATSERWVAAGAIDGLTHSLQIATRPSVASGIAKCSRCNEASDEETTPNSLGFRRFVCRSCEKPFNGPLTTSNFVKHILSAIGLVVLGLWLLANGRSLSFNGVLAWSCFMAIPAGALLQGHLNRKVVS